MSSNLVAKSRCLHTSKKKCRSLCVSTLAIDALTEYGSRSERQIRTPTQRLTFFFGCVQLKSVHMISHNLFWLLNWKRAFIFRGKSVPIQKARSKYYTKTKGQSFWEIRFQKQRALLNKIRGHNTMNRHIYAIRRTHIHVLQRKVFDLYQLNYH